MNASFSFFLSFTQSLSLSLFSLPSKKIFHHFFSQSYIQKVISNFLFLFFRASKSYSLFIFLISTKASFITICHKLDPASGLYYSSILQQNWVETIKKLKDDRYQRYQENTKREVIVFIFRLRSRINLFAWLVMKAEVEAEAEAES